MSSRGFGVRLAGVLILSALVPGAVGAQMTQGGVADYIPPPARGQTFDLSIRSIMRAQENVGSSPGQVRWTDDSEWVYFRWQPGGQAWDAGSEQYRVPAGGGTPELVSDEEMEDVAIMLAGGDVTDDGRWRISSMGGDLYLVDRRSWEVRQLTDTRANEGGAQFSADESTIFYREGTNLFAMDVEDGTVTQLTDVRSGSAGGRDEPEAEGLQAFLEEQQLELFEYIRRQQERQEQAEAEREAREAGEPQPLFIPQGESAGGLSPSPDGSYVLVSTFRQGPSTQNTSIPFWITESGYTEPRNGRSKVGDGGPGGGRVGFITVASNEATWVDPKPDDYEGDVQAGTGSWNDAGTHALVSARSDNDEDAWLYALDATTGELTLLDSMHDDAWLGGPCGFGCQGWIPGTNTAYYVTEETGYAHLYTINADGTGKRALTSGEWEVLGVGIPDGEDRFFIETNEGSPFNEHAGWLDFDGGDIDYLTEGEGRYSLTLSPDGERMAVVHDVANRPPELFLADAERGADMERITTSPTDEWLSFPWIKPEIIHFQAEDGTMVPARIYRPSDLGAEPNGAGVLFVHGAGYLHNVHNYWSSYYREYQFNHFLAANGYTVLDVDYRGSAGYGRDWRTAIYRWMGGLDLSDNVDGARYLVENEGVDADRIGLYGGSYGGFLTLMGLFTAGDTFKSGAALRSVTDWAHYNDGYTSNILNDPQEDPEAYERSSPIYFAENFGPDQHLVMLHGMVDTNVHFSDVVRLTQRLIELGKENWELAVFPVENHGFTIPSSWTDEYRRIFELFERTLSRPGCTDDGALCAVRGKR